MGERKGYRDGMDRMTRRLVEQGVSPDRARALTRDAARRAERNDFRQAKDVPSDR